MERSTWCESKITLSVSRMVNHDGRVISEIHRLCEDLEQLGAKVSFKIETKDVETYRSVDW